MELHRRAEQYLKFGKLLIVGSLGVLPKVHTFVFPVSMQLMCAYSLRSRFSCVPKAITKLDFRRAMKVLQEEHSTIRVVRHEGGSSALQFSMSRIKE